MEKREAFKFTGEDAENYDQYLGPILFEPYGQYLASVIDTSNLNSVLELASGTGRVTRHIHSVLPGHVKFYATDISNDMLNVAKREVKADGIIYQVEDAQNLTFPDNSFDLVICQFGMMFLQDKNKGFAEIFRVLKPGGKFLFFTWDDALKMPLLKLLVNDLVTPVFDGEDTTRFFVPFSLYDPEVLQGFLKTAGFKNIEVENVVLPSGSPDIKNVVNAFFRKHMLGKEVSAKAPAAYEQVAQKFEEQIGVQFGAVNPKFVLSAFLTSGQK